ncbi:MAG: hypothetical protein J7527_15990, partial [Chitinophagaceae bacterium]|nr:hypothetical protein [Chitinophagaceae bacterium]
MIRAVENTINYFKAPENYFWRWGENLEAIEWISGAGTICFKDDLALILKQFPGGKLPRLGALLLVLSAFNHPVKGRSKIVLCQLFGIQRVSDEKEVFDFLERINSLPPSLRSGDKRLRLLRELFGEADPVQETFEASIIELQSGRIDNELMMAGPRVTDEFFQADLQALKETALRFETVQRLGLFLNTGVESLPEPPSIEIPEKKLAKDLFDQLLEDPQTAGMARLARRLLSIIHIPIHARAGGEDSYGGIADITNRGNYDRLLLSELAQDELLLTARLVNNEALYFRREEPPAEPRNRRILLIDSTIKMWGVPRVFAIAAALAFSRNSKHGEQVDAYVLMETTYEQISLEDKEGVINALTQLHPALHPGKALENAVRELSSGEETEFILVTEDRQLKHAGFYADFFKVKERISFALTVDRDGDIRFAEYNNGHAKVLNEAKLDLHEIFHSSEKKAGMPGTKYSKLTERPLDKTQFAFFAKPKLPLLMPKKRAAMKETLMGSDADGSLVLIDRNKRVLRLSSSNRGARELMDCIEHGRYFMKTLSSSLCCIAVLGENDEVLMYRISLEDGKVVRCDLSLQVVPIDVAYFANDEYLHLFGGTEYY